MILHWHRTTELWFFFQTLLHHPAVCFLPFLLFVQVLPCWWWFCIAGPWDLTGSRMDIVFPEILEAPPSSGVTVSFLCPSGPLHHVWIFSFSPKNNCIQSWFSSADPDPLRESSLVLEALCSHSWYPPAEQGWAWPSLTFSDNCVVPKMHPSLGKVNWIVYCNTYLRCVCVEGAGECFLLSCWVFSRNPFSHFEGFPALVYSNWPLSRPPGTDVAIYHAAMHCSETQIKINWVY